METTRNRFELRVGTFLSPAALVTFRVPVRLTSVPRNTVRRLRILADRDLADVVRRLSERHVELLEIRRGPEPSRSAPRQPAGDEREVPAPADTGADVIPLRPVGRRRPPAVGPVGRSLLEPTPPDPAG